MLGTCKSCVGSCAQQIHHHCYALALHTLYPYPHDITTFYCAPTNTDLTVMCMTVGLHKDNVVYIVSTYLQSRVINTHRLMVGTCIHAQLIKVNCSVRTLMIYGSILNILNRTMRLKQSCYLKIFLTLIIGSLTYRMF